MPVPRGFPCCWDRKPSKPPAVLRERRKLLAVIFDELDLDVSGTLDKAELINLGRAMEKSNQGWTAEMTDTFFNDIEENKDGSVDRTEFVTYFENSLPQSMADYREQVGVIHDCSQGIRAGSGQGLSKDDKADRERRQALAVVFDELDLDLTGELTADELMAFGKVQTAQGGSSGAWTDESNTKLLSDLDKSGDSSVDRGEFVAFYDKTLPRDRKAFRDAINALTKCAEEMQAQQ